MYLHMLIPSIHQQNLDEDYVLPKSVNSTNSIKRVYYEVGCRVLELNKIYK